MVQILAGGDVVATHVRAEKGRRTNFDHYPPEKIAFHMRTPTWCRRTAEQVGPAGYNPRWTSPVRCAVSNLGGQR